LTDHRRTHPVTWTRTRENSDRRDERQSRLKRK
jgi:hypothetical protein